jgi:hypothetical protein
MLKPGTLVGDALEANSMALAIEQAMVAQGMLVLDEEQPEAAENRRKTFIAIATGVINHLKANIEIVVAVNKFSASVPNAETKLLGSANEVR